MNRFLLSNLWPDEAQSDLQSNASVPETESSTGEFQSCSSAEILVAGGKQEPTKPTMLSELRDTSFSTQVGQDDELSQNLEVNNPKDNYIKLARAKTERILAENAHLHQEIMTLGIENSKLKRELNEKSAIDERRIKEIVKGLERHAEVKLRKEIRELQANNSALEKENQLNLNGAVDVARHKCETEQSSLSTKLNHAFVEIARLEKDLDISRVQSESMNEMLVSAKIRENELKKKLHLELKILTETAEHDKQTIAKFAKVCHDSKSQIGIQTRKANDQAKLFDDKVKTYEEKQKILEAEVLELKNKLASLESENQTLKRDWAKSNETAKISLAKSNSKIKDIESLRVTEKQVNDHLSKQLEELKTSEIKALQAHKVVTIAFTEFKKEASETIAKMNEKLDYMTSKLEILEVARNLKEKTIATCRQNVNIERKKNRDYIAELLNSVRKTKVEHQLFKEEVASIHSEFFRLFGQHSDKAHDQIRLLKQSGNEKLSLLEIQNETVGKQLLKTIDELTSTEAQNHELKAMVASLKSESDKLRINTQLMPSLSKMWSIFMELQSLVSSPIEANEIIPKISNSRMDISMHYFEKTGKTLICKLKTDRLQFEQLREENKELELQYLSLKSLQNEMINRFGLILEGKCSSSCQSISSRIRTENDQQKALILQHETILAQIQTKNVSLEKVVVPGHNPTLRTLIKLHQNLSSVSKLPNSLNSEQGLKKFKQVTKDVIRTIRGQRSGTNASNTFWKAATDHVIKGHEKFSMSTIKLLKDFESISTALMTTKDFDKLQQAFQSFVPTLHEVSDDLQKIQLLARANTTKDSEIMTLKSKVRDQLKLYPLLQYLESVFGIIPAKELGDRVECVIEELININSDRDSLLSQLNTLEQNIAERDTFVRLQMERIDNIGAE